VLANVLDLVEVDVQLSEPIARVLAQDDAGHVDAGEGDLVKKYLKVRAILGHIRY
jgi:hypothetical protein